MNTMESLLQSDAVLALGWTLVHAIWQIAGIAFLLMVALTALRARSPQLRHGAALAAMVTTVMVSAFTFLLCYRHFSGRGPAAQPTGEVPAAFGVQAAAPGYFESIAGFFYQNLFVFLALWMGGVILLSLRFAGSMWFLHRLKANALPVSGQWAVRLAKMAKESGIRRAVRLAESAMVNAPVMIGHLKPFILVPMGMLAAIPADQVEAILAHELAHIRRNDFLVNLLQSLVEIVYFFHPGIWWISGVLRRERELCCDDMATRGGCNPVTLAFALSEVGEWMQAEKNGKLVLAFSGKKEKPLLERVKRLLGHEAARPSGLFPVGTLAAAVIVFLLLSGSGRVFSSSSEEMEQDRPAEAGQKTAAGTDALPAYGGSSVEIRRGTREIVSQDGNGAAETENWKALAGTDTLPSPSAAPSASPTPSAAPSASPSPVAPEAPQPPVFPVDMSEMPLPPAPDSLPAPPAVPAPPTPPVLDSAVWSQFGANMEDFGVAIANWSLNFVGKGDTTKVPDFKFNFDEESWKEFELSMEEFGKKMEVWGEKYGKKMEAWAKANEPKMKEFELKMKNWEKENKPRLKEYEQKMEEYHKSLKEFHQHQGTERQRTLNENRQHLQENRQNLNEDRQRLQENRQNLNKDRQRLQENRQRLEAPRQQE